VAVDSFDNVYVADRLNDVIRKVTLAGVVTTLAGTAVVAGSADGTVFQLGLCGPVGRSMSHARIVRSLADGACFAADSVGRDNGRKSEASLAALWRLATD
jgi:hypothetical protein